jgi:uncharacterized protein DUF6456
MSEGLPDAIGRLAAARRYGPPFLLPHHVAAALRLVQAFERARLRQRVTMSYDPTRTGGRGRGGAVQGEISASAADARRHLADIAGRMPADCWAILFDICGLDRGLQDVEAERDWPRRGGKLVLRIALSHLAAHYGLEAEARGREAQRQRHWRPERAQMFPAGERD